MTLIIAVYLSSIFCFIIEAIKIGLCLCLPSAEFTVLSSIYQIFPIIQSREIKAVALAFYSNYSTQKIPLYNIKELHKSLRPAPLAAPSSGPLGRHTFVLHTEHSYISSNRNPDPPLSEIEVLRAGQPYSSQAGLKSYQIARHVRAKG